MKNMLTVILLILYTLASATDYYVSSTGNDANSGRSPSTPWRTIEKVNLEFPNFSPGDRILFNRGDTFYGNLQITKSGAVNNVIYFGAYGTGEKPVLTGFTKLKDWTNEGNGIYSKVISCESSPEMVIINGVQYVMGRWPNSAVWPKAQTWARIDSDTGGDGSDITITDDDMHNSNVIDWTGAEVVIHNSNRNKITRYTITDHIDKTLTFPDPNPNYRVRERFGYFIQNHMKTLDTFGEWYYDGTTFYMYFGSKNPDDFKIEVSTIDFIITFTPFTHYHTFENLAFYGANSSAIYSMRNNHITIQYCDVAFSGSYALRGHAAEYININNNTITNSNDCAIFLNSNCNHAYIGHNTATNTGLYPGMGGNYWESGKTFYLAASHNKLVEYNRIFNSGFSGIHFSGDNDIIRYNLIDKFGLMKEDCGGIQYGAQTTYKNIEISNNIILNGVGWVSGLPIGISSTMIKGIYFDYNSTGGHKILNNVVANISQIGILISASPNMVIENNLVYNCRLRSIQISDITDVRVPPFNTTLLNNIFFATESTQWCLFVLLDEDEFDQLSKPNGDIDYNIYARPINKNTPIFAQVGWGTSNPGALTLSQWQEYGYDKNGGISPVDISSVDEIHFIYNETQGKKYFNLSAPMVDARGNNYSGTITLEPWKSLVLIGKGTVEEISLDESPSGQFTLRIYTEGIGSVEVNGINEINTITAEKGAKIKLAAIAKDDWQFNAWDDDLQSNSSMVSFNIQRNMKVTAKFGKIPTAQFPLAIDPSTDILSDKEKNIIIYPNPARDYFRISIKDPLIEPELIRILDFHGRIVHEDLLGQSDKEVQIPGFINSGIYIVELLLGSLPFYAQRLLISR